ncbi:MAG TPA: GNAT family acetyltransferase [Anaerolineales bacterium]|nr:GNAT family acetyltransferase [Anaerolineales bacterium]
MRNNPPYEIRLYRHPEDYAAVVHLWGHAGPGIHVRRSDQPEEIAKKLQRDPDLFLVAQDGSQIVGTVLGGFDGRRGMVYHLAVAEAYRQQGLGAALMQELEDRLRQKGCIRCYLLVTKDNLNAQRLYEDHGWECMDIYTYGKNL